MPDGNDIEPPIYENHNRMQMITSFAYYMHMIKFLYCSVMYWVHIWQKNWIHLEIPGNNDIINGLTIIFKVMSIWISMI